MKATPSAPSMRSHKTAASELEDEKEIDEYMEIAYNKYKLPYKVVVRKDIQQGDQGKSLKSSDTTMRKQINNLPSKMSDSLITNVEMTSRASLPEEETIILTAVYNNMHQFIKLSLNRLKTVPRTLLQILELILHKYRYLNKIAVTYSHIDRYTVYKINKILDLISVTEVSFDGSPLRDANYELLLDKPNLNSLSLRRCSINDETCEKLALKLHYLGPAETSLFTLNLSSNHITDLGAKHLGLALRSNRHLRYLNLADNRITNEGFEHILRPMAEFPLTYEELMSKRHDNMIYLKKKQDIELRYLKEFNDKSYDDTCSSLSSSKKTTKDTPKTKNKSNKDNITDTESNVDNADGDFNGFNMNPFSSDTVKTIDGYSYCDGNMNLCYLNMAYNNVSYLSVKKLLEVVQYQCVTKKPFQMGLMKVVIDGNNIPTSCVEYEAMSQILYNNIVNFSPKSQDKGQKGRLTRRISISTERSVTKNKTAVAH